MSSAAASPDQPASGAVPGGEKCTKDLVIENKLGLHARPSAQFVKVAARHQAEIWVEKDGEQVNGKSIMGLMMLAAGQGSKLRVSAEGPDANEAIAELESLVRNRFSEE
ncbi:MAG: HPr family phosphocarrier protein [Verrucomicrobia bacterium]|nr:HPr family phosphocarrier protein [Verrucomicrobiota bacterium]MBV9658280.1 HPr family phosphocarrier protein [Verrucomicrobiota bacterium]